MGIQLVPEGRTLGLVLERLVFYKSLNLVDYPRTVVTAIVGVVIVASFVGFEFSVGISLIVAAVAILFGIVGSYLGDDFWHASWNPLQWLRWWE